MQIRKPFYSNADHTQIDVEAKHPQLGWIPMTLMAAVYPELWAKAVAMTPAINQGFVDEQEARDMEATRDSLALARGPLCLHLRRLGALTQAEALEAAQGGWPGALQQVMAKATPAVAPEDAAILWAGAQSIKRTDPFIEALRKHLNLTPIQMDELFS